jgi:hypothetical protein
MHIGSVVNQLITDEVETALEIMIRPAPRCANLHMPWGMLSYSDDEATLRSELTTF